VSPAEQLLAWYDREKRVLPWRGTRDSYRIWVSEVMLQQTTVQAVAPRYDAFLARFPTLASLARAREQSVLAEWSGLGYYARARNLHRAARAVVREHGGRLPRSAEALRALPGFGEYTAAAVASLAFGESVPAAEANVTRVLSRVHAIPGVTGSRLHEKEVRRRAGEWQRDVQGRAGDLTAALMDLGQLVCRPRSPACPLCPIAPACAARRLGVPERYPRRRPKPPTIRVYVAAAVAVRDGRALLLQRPERRLQRLWQFPAAEARSPEAALAALGRELGALGLRRDPSVPPSGTRHTIMNRDLRIAVYPASPNPRARIQDPKAGVRWLAPKQLDRAAIPTLTRKIALASGFLPEG
jgi:A/G-specific adenine glycosylase